MLSNQVGPLFSAGRPFAAPLGEYTRMHKARTPELLLSMRDALAPLPLQDVAVARAYCAGFLATIFFFGHHGASVCVFLAGQFNVDGRGRA